jgi:photosystem II stability/assembly factor-like uncharacterized protein
MAADPANADHLLYSNGHALMLSTDGGCTWQTIFTLDPSPDFPQIVGAADKIVRVHIYGDQIYAHIVYQQHGAGSWVIFSHDLGKTFKPATVGLPPPPGLITYSKSLDVAPSDPQTAYFVVERDADTPRGNIQGQSYGMGLNLDSIFASTDGGETWTERSLPTGRSTSIGENMQAQLTVDASDPNTLWVFGQDSPTYRSVDGGNTWAKVSTATPGDVTGNYDVDTVKAGIFTAILAVPRGPGDNSFILRSDDGGQSFYKIPTPGSPESVLFLGSPTKVVVEASALYRIDTRSNRWVDISPPGADSLFWKAFAQAGAKTVLFTSNTSGLFRYTGRL